ncbi:hypothetical protein Mal64_35930 [Pseudobythopirellula maris]|uniref:Uncharacterized protein n=1 Tax=Pseudobythopirellula maris TaxID=2527991 RepID=A0A5C5ZJX7_9BACT|nr:heavy metal-binding domain-containing protein [Pseudobythopirellula maris]TWT86763.1 hypothetical protein Mal64_35930 [Pseudobythopirellula maris]
MTELLINIGFLLFFLSLGLIFGTAMERRHLRRLESREQAHAGFLVTQLKSYPGAVDTSVTPRMYAAEAVVATDYLKSFLSGIRKFFGGELKSYKSLLERARREAQMKVVEQAAADGYDTACNFRYITADIGGALNPKQKSVIVAMLVSATAYKRLPPQ